MQKGSAAGSGWHCNISRNVCPVGLPEEGISDEGPVGVLWLGELQARVTLGLSSASKGAGDHDALASAFRLLLGPDMGCEPAREHESGQGSVMLRQTPGIVHDIVHDRLCKIAEQLWDRPLLAAVS